MIFEAQREQNICPVNNTLYSAHLYPNRQELTTYSTVMLAPPGRKYTLAVITLLAVFVIHPIIFR